MDGFLNSIFAQIICGTIEQHGLLEPHISQHTLACSSVTRVISLTDWSQIGFMHTPDNQMLHGVSCCVMARESWMMSFTEPCRFTKMLHSWNCCASYEIIAKNNSNSSPSTILYGFLTRLEMWLIESSKALILRIKWKKKKCLINRLLLKERIKVPQSNFKLQSIASLTKFGSYFHSG